jgi:serine/threonine protein phosphatase PrpC
LENDLKEDDKFLIVASDGVWEYLENQEVAELIAPFYLRGDLDLACERVIRVASEVWQKVSLSRDDITLIVVNLHEPSNNF